VNSIEREIALLSAQIVTGSDPDIVIGNNAKVCLPSVVRDEASLESENDSDYSVKDPSCTADTVKLFEDEAFVADTVELLEEEELVDGVEKYKLISECNNDVDECNVVGDINQQETATIENSLSEVEQRNMLLVHVSASVQYDPRTCEEDTINEIPDSLGANNDMTYKATAVENVCFSDSDNDIFVSPTQEDSCSVVGLPVFVKAIGNANSADDSDVDGAVDLQNTSILYPSHDAKKSEACSYAPKGIERSANCAMVKLGPIEAHKHCRTDDVAFNRKETQVFETLTISSNESMPTSDQTTQPGTAVNRLRNSPEFSSGRVRNTQNTSFPTMAHWTFVVSGIGKDTDQVIYHYMVGNLFQIRMCYVINATTCV